MKIGPSLNNHLIVSKIEKSTIYPKDGQFYRDAIYYQSANIDNILPSTYYEFNVLLSGFGNSNEVTVGSDSAQFASRILRYDYDNKIVVYSRNLTSFVVSAPNIIDAAVMSAVPSELLIVDYGVHQQFAGADIVTLDSNNAAIVQSVSSLKFTVDNLSENNIKVKVYIGNVVPSTANYDVFINGDLIDRVAGFNADVQYHHPGGDLVVEVVCANATITVERVLVVKNLFQTLACTNGEEQNRIYLDGICNIPINIYSICTRYEVYRRTTGEFLGNIWSNGFGDELSPAGDACVKWGKLPGTQKFPPSGEYFGPQTITTNTVNVAAAYGYSTLVGNISTGQNPGNQVLIWKTKPLDDGNTNTCNSSIGWCSTFDGNINDINEDIYVRRPTYYILISKCTNLYYSHTAEEEFDNDKCGCNIAENLFISVGQSHNIQININSIYDSPVGTYASGPNSIANIPLAKWLILKPADDACFLNDDLTNIGTAPDTEQFDINSSAQAGFSAAGFIDFLDPCAASVELIPVSTSNKYSIYDLVFTNTTAGGVTLRFFDGSTVVVDYNDTEQEIRSKIVSVIDSQNCDVVRSGGFIRISIDTTVAKNPIIIIADDVSCDPAMLLPPTGPFLIDISNKQTIDVEPDPPVPCHQCPTELPNKFTVVHDVIRYERITAEQLLVRYGFGGGVVYTPLDGSLDVVHPSEKLVMNTRYYITRSNVSYLEAFRIYKTSKFIYAP